MDLSNTIRKADLVVLKEGVKGFDTERTTFKANTFYRSIFLENESHVEVLIHGEIFVNDSYSDNFELAHTRILRDFETIGIVENNKLVSKTAFGKLCNIHTYGGSRNGLKIAFIYTHPKELMYGFFPYFRGGNKKQVILDAYNEAQSIVDGNLTSIDRHIVQFGNQGLPLSAGGSTRLRVG